jgi:hypothetical protein
MRPNSVPYTPYSYAGAANPYKHEDQWPQRGQVTYGPDQAAYGPGQANYGSSQYGSGQYAPNHYAPNHYVSGQFGSDQYAPNQYDSGQFDLGGQFEQYGPPSHTGSVSEPKWATGGQNRVHQGRADDRAPRQGKTSAAWHANGPPQNAHTNGPPQHTNSPPQNAHTRTNSAAWHANGPPQNTHSPPQNTNGPPGRTNDPPRRTNDSPRASGHGDTGGIEPSGPGYGPTSAPTKRKNKKNRSGPTTPDQASGAPRVEQVSPQPPPSKAPVFSLEGPIIQSLAISGSTDQPAIDGLIEQELEAARVEAYAAYDKAIDIVSDSFLNAAPDDPEYVRETEEVLRAMEIYRGLTGHFPYNNSYWFCPPAFTEYLKVEGLRQPEIYEDVKRYIIEAARAPAERGGPMYWDAYRDALQASTREWPDKELYFYEVAPGASRVVIEAAQLGFVDHRLEHAITLIQRMIRYRNAPARTGQTHEEWLAEFERLHHSPDPSWHEKGIHLASFADTTKRFEGADSDAETSFVFWNRRCIPEFIETYARSSHNVYEFEFAFGVLEALGDGDRESKFPRLEQLVAEKRERFYEKSMQYLLDDDALAKTNALIRVYAEGGLGKLRNPRRDVLKFLSFSLNESGPGPQNGPDSKQVAKCYLERLDALPLHAVGEIFRAMPKCLATHGRDIVYRFSKLDVDALAPHEVREWFLEIVIDEVADVCAGTQVEEREFRAFLRECISADRGGVSAGRYAAAAGLARGKLADASARIRAKKPLYDYSIWVEPVKVKAVTLVDDREAALGQ